MNKFLLAGSGAAVTAVVLAGYFFVRAHHASPTIKSIARSTTGSNQPTLNPLSIAAMRQKSYPGSALTIEQTLTPGVGYQQYIASYLSEGLKIYGLLTIPDGKSPPGGWPVIIFDHGYIPPQVYRTTERYVAYVADLARNGYIVFKPDYRGNGKSQGQPEGAYYSPAYTTDVLNAVATLKEFSQANPNLIGMWGHSMGGNIALRALVVDTKDIKAAVIWGGVVGSYNDIINNWQHHVRYQPPESELTDRNRFRQQLFDTYGTPSTNPAFWQSIDPTSYLADVTIPIQLDTGGSDEEVPPAFSQELYQKLKALGKTVEYYDYPGGDHNISPPNYELAMGRTIQFFNRYLKKAS